MKSSGTDAEQLVRIAARAEALERDAEAHFLERAELCRRGVHVLLGDGLGDLEADALGFVRAIGELGLEPLGEAIVEHAVAREADEEATRLAFGGKRQRCPHHPAVDVLQQVVALGRGHELRGQDFLALVVEHAHQHVEHVRVFALKARHRLLHQAEAVLHERGFDVFDPDLVVGLHARVGVGLVEMEDLVAALAAPGAHGGDHIGDDGIDARAGGRNGSEADGAARVQSLLSDGRRTFAEARQHGVRPRFHVVRIAALEQREERDAGQPAGNVIRTEMRLERGGVFGHQLFAGAHAHVFLEFGELVGPHQCHETHTAGGRRGNAHANGIEQWAAQQQARGGVAPHRVGQVAS